eukprot:scaffold68236_cov24-Tisochrysis_lutea.AAC.1
MTMPGRHLPFTSSSRSLLAPVDAGHDALCDDEGECLQLHGEPKRPEGLARSARHLHEPRESKGGRPVIAAHQHLIKGAALERAQLDAQAGLHAGPSAALAVADGADVGVLGDKGVAVLQESRKCVAHAKRDKGGGPGRREGVLGWGVVVIAAQHLHTFGDARRGRGHWHGEAGGEERWGARRGGDRQEREGNREGSGQEGSDRTRTPGWSRSRARALQPPRAYSCARALAQHTHTHTRRAPCVRALRRNPSHMRAGRGGVATKKLHFVLSMTRSSTCL